MVVCLRVVTLIAIGILLPGVQANSIAISVNNAFGLNVSITAVILVSYSLPRYNFRWIKRIGSAAEYIVPFMGGAYILMALIIIAVNIA